MTRSPRPTKKRWDLDGDLERLERQLKEGGSKALATVDAALERMKMKEVGKEKEKDERR